MKTVLLKAESIEEVKWPTCCMACGRDLSEEAGNRSGKDAETAKIRGHWEALGSDHLLEVWSENNDTDWRPETFQVIKNILEERGVAVPPRPPTPPRPNFQIDIPVRRGVGAILLPSKPNKIGIRFCPECGPRMEAREKWFEGFAFFGYLMSVIGMMGGFFDIDVFNKIFGTVFDTSLPTMLDHPHRPVHEALTLATRSMYIVLFFSGAIIGWLGDGFKRRACGIMVQRMSKNCWRFWFRQKDVALEFARLNDEHLSRSGDDC